MTLLAVNTFSSQIILRIGQPETNEFEEIFPKVFRRTITQLAFTVTNVLDIFKDYMDYYRINCIFCPESLFPTLQYVYRNHFSQNKTLRIKISQTLLIDVTTMEEQNQLIEETHERAHRGISENIKAISAKHYFPHLKKKVTTYINLCKTCKKNKYDRKPYKITFADTPIPKRPLDIMHIDIFFASPDIYLSAVDKLSRFAILTPIKSRTIADVRSALLILFMTHGNPKLIVCDNEAAFKSIEIRGILQNLNIETYFTPSGHSEVNGIVERFHSTLSEIYRCMKEKYKDLPQKDIYSIATNLYNHSIHSATNLRPIDIFYGIKEGEERDINLEKMLEARNKFYDEVILQLEQNQKKTRSYQNQAREEQPELKTGEEVFLKDHRVRNKQGDRFTPIRVDKDHRKTFTDDRGRRLHKSKIKRKTK